MIEDDRLNKITVGADKAYDSRDFVDETRAMNATPHEMAFGVVTAALDCAFDKTKSDVSFDFTGSEAAACRCISTTDTESA